MLEKPALSDHLIAARLQQEYGLKVARVEFLPLGVDVNTAVYRIVTEGEAAYFLKLRKGPFDEIGVALPQFLKFHAVQAIIAPLQTSAGQLWGTLDTYRTILYPFVQGNNGYKASLSEQQWVEFGAALRQVHTAQIPAALLRRIPLETYSPRWRDMAKNFLVQAEKTAFSDSIASKLAAFMRARRAEIRYMLERADRLGRALASRSLQFVCCHSDIHPGNLLIAEIDRGTSAGFFIVDWDAPILAPKEHDLTLIGGCYTWKDAGQVALFYRGYFPGYDRNLPGVDRMALAYYRYERIIQDIAAFCEQLFLSTAGGEDREQAYQYFTSIFLPDHEFDLARNTEKPFD
jgi:spectinomycin phosphotransferase